jgi:spore coat protein JB
VSVLHNQTHCPIARDELLKKLSILDFMLMDLGLYLNSYPTCQKALAIHSQAAKDAEHLRQEYETKFGPLRSCSPYSDHTSWRWTQTPWPWETAANFTL